MKWGKQAHIARKAQITPQLINHYLTGRKYASAPIADRLAALMNTDIRVWLKGGDIPARRAAVESFNQAL